jgi:hypothetical protein
MDIRESKKGMSTSRESEVFRMLSTRNFSDAFRMVQTGFPFSVETIMLYTIDTLSSLGITTLYGVWAFAKEKRERKANKDLSISKSKKELIKLRED